MKKIIYDGTTVEEILQEYYSPELRLLCKNKGNTGYFVKYTDCCYITYGYDFISKQSLINRICDNYSSERKRKLVSLKIFND